MNEEQKKYIYEYVESYWKACYYEDGYEKLYYAILKGNWIDICNEDISCIKKDIVEELHLDEENENTTDEVLDEIKSNYKKLEDDFLEKVENQFKNNKTILEEKIQEWEKLGAIVDWDKLSYWDNQPFVSVNGKNIGWLVEGCSLPTGYGEGIHSIAETFDFDETVEKIEKRIVKINKAKVVSNSIFDYFEKNKILGYHDEGELDRAFRILNEDSNYQDYADEIRSYLGSKGCDYITSCDSNWGSILVYREQDEVFIESYLDKILNEYSERALEVPFYLVKKYRKIYDDHDETVIRKRDLRDTLNLLIDENIISLSEFKSVPTPTLYRFKDGGELNHKNRTALKKELLFIIKSKSVFF